MSTTMSTTSSYARPLFPYAAGLIGTILLSVGTMSQVSQDLSSYSFGVIPFSSPSSTSKQQSSRLQPITRTFIRLTGLRDAMVGTMLLSLVTFWRFSAICRDNVVARAAVQKCIGIFVMVGAMGGSGDGLLVRAYREAEGVSEEAKERAEGRQWGHFLSAVVCTALGGAMFFL